MHGSDFWMKMVGMSELLMEDLSKDSIQYENAREILTAGKRGADLVNQISEMAETIRKVLDAAIG
jgi:dsDNA-binding SOS-regulon protein